MPKVIVTPNSSYNPIGVRLLLGEVGVSGPMFQDDTTITCVMTDDQIARFRNSRGAAHKLEIVPEAPPPAPVVEEHAHDLEHIFQDAAAAEFPQTWGKQGEARVIVHDADTAAQARRAGYLRVSPDPLSDGVHSEDEPPAQDPTAQSTTPILDITAKKGKK